MPVAQWGIGCQMNTTFKMDLSQAAPASKQAGIAVFHEVAGPRHNLPRSTFD